MQHLKACDLYHKILLCYYDKTKEVIYESVNLKGEHCLQPIGSCKRAFLGDLATVI